MPDSSLGIQLPMAWLLILSLVINRPAQPWPSQLSRPPALLLKTSLDVTPVGRSMTARGWGS